MSCRSRYLKSPNIPNIPLTTEMFGFPPDPPSGARCALRARPFMALPNIALRATRGDVLARLSETRRQTTKQDDVWRCLVVWRQEEGVWR